MILWTVFARGYHRRNGQQRGFTIEITSLYEVVSERSYYVSRPLARMYPSFLHNGDKGSLYLSLSERKIERNKISYNV